MNFLKKSFIFLVEKASDLKHAGKVGHNFVEFLIFFTKFENLCQGIVLPLNSIDLMSMFPFFSFSYYISLFHRFSFTFSPILI
jgi:hypothetical protein